MEVPKSNHEVHFLREKWSHIRWIASKLASNVFADKTKSEVKQDLTMSISWGKPDDKKDMLQAQKIVDQVSNVDSKAISNSRAAE